MQVKAKKIIELNKFPIIFKDEVFDLIGTNYGVKILVNGKYISPNELDGEVKDNFELA